MAQQFERVILEAQPVISASAVGTEGLVGETIMALLNAAEDNIKSLNLTVVGPPFARFDPVDDELVEVEAGFPVEQATATDGHPAGYSILPGGEAIVSVHIGGYDGLALAHARLKIHLVEEALTARETAWEFYVDDPDQTPIDEVRTRIVQPIE